MTRPLRLLVERSNPLGTRLVDDPDAPSTRPLAEGEARLRVERVALTANNISYATYGEALKYWNYFPCREDGWGCVPAWGYATVDESRCADLAVGRRVYGFLPMGTCLVVQPARVRGRGFVDAAPHRAGLPAIYNEYLDTATDPLHRDGREDLQALLRPLFSTSFLLADHLAELGFHGAAQIVVSSASSKTAYGFAFCARGLPGVPRLIGLSSARNLAFTRSLGCYDDVVPYNGLEAIDATQPLVYVDFSGDAGLRRQLHEQYADVMRHDCRVGGSHWQAASESTASSEVLPGPRPTLFFAPEQARRRLQQPPSHWPPGGLEAALGSAWAAFIDRVGHGDAPWLSVRGVYGWTEGQSAYAELAAGTVAADQGLLVHVQP